MTATHFVIYTLSCRICISLECSLLVSIIQEGYFAAYKEVSACNWGERERAPH